MPPPWPLDTTSMLSDGSVLDENMLPDERSLVDPPDSSPTRTIRIMSLSTMSEPTVSDASDDHHSHPPQLSELVFVASSVLQQALDLVDNVLTDNNQLTVQSKYLPGSTIGKHIRHARDHFTLLIDCAVGGQPYILSYDVRTRNTPMESSLPEAHNALVSALSRLKVLETTPSMLDQLITLNAVTPFPHTFKTTFGRELWFAALHAVHHWSMVRVIAGELDVSLPDDGFGFAPSTLVYRGSDAALGKTKI